MPVLIRQEPGYRRAAFVEGLQAVGQDPLVLWNRYGAGDRMAEACERQHQPVLIAENGPLGREWRGGYWYTICRSWHNTVGTFPDGGPERWNGWNVELKPWRATGTHILVLPARGIGSFPVAQPADWLNKTLKGLKTTRPIKVRPHPGEREPPTKLEEDLKDAWCVVTWGSGAALKALLAGIPVFYGYQDWIGRDAGLPIGSDIESPFLGDRLPMFQKLAWCMWEVSEIRKGDLFRSLLLPHPGQAKGTDGLRSLR